MQPGGGGEIALTPARPFPYPSPMQLKTLPPVLQPDGRAVAVAQAIYGAARPRRLILFGSRARGDHREDSDIDILIVTDEPPAESHKEKVCAAAERCAAAQYQHPVPVQLVWNTAAEYRQRRRTVNHLVARAIDDGVLMPETLADYDDQGDDYSYEWTVTSERVRNAEQHLDTFQLLAEGGRSDRMLGKNAQEGMEHALKAVISAAGARYERTHNLHRLLQQAQAADPELNFTPRSDFRALMQYRRRVDHYPPQDPMTNSPTYREDVVADLTILLERARRDLPPAA